MTCQHVPWPPIKVQVCLRWPSLALGQGPRDRGREVLPYCCQSRSSTEHMKGIHSRFYGPRWLLKPLLGREFMYPIARINNASLIRDPRHRDPWREGCWEMNQVQCAPCQICAPPQIIIPTNIFIGKNLFHKFIKHVPQYIFQCVTFNQSSILHTRKLMLQTCCCLQRYQGDSFHEFPSGCIFALWFKQHQDEMYKIKSFNFLFFLYLKTVYS